jgi:hypothetical protein
VRSSLTQRGWPRQSDNLQVFSSGPHCILERRALADGYGERQQDAQVVSAAEVLHKIWPLLGVIVKQLCNI